MPERGNNSGFTVQLWYGRNLRIVHRINYPTLMKRKTRSPSVAFANYDIKDSRSSFMSSMLLLCAIMEGVASFVLPIIDAFGPPKHEEHKFYFEVFQILQFVISIAALAYLQGLISYYDRKFLRQERRFAEMADQIHDEDLPTIHIDHVTTPDMSDSDHSWSPSLSASPNQQQDMTDYNYAQETCNGGSSNNFANYQFVDDDIENILPPTKEDDEEVTDDRGSRRIGESQLPIYNVSDDPLGVHDMEDSEADGACPTDSPKLKQNNKINALLTVESSKRPTPPSDRYTNNLAAPINSNGMAGVSFLSNSRLGSPAELSTSPTDLRLRRPSVIGKLFGDEPGPLLPHSPPLNWDGEGINLYLRLGAVVFGFGVMILDGFRVADRFQEDNSTNACHSVLWIPTNVIHSVYIFWQTYFLFKYHRVIFNVQKFFLRFILSHMSVVNLGQWLSTVVQEVMSTTEIPVNANSLNHTTAIVKNLVQNETVTEEATNASLIIVDRIKYCHSEASVLAHYLIPCSVEYSLIACAIFYKMFQRIGNGWSHHPSQTSSDAKDADSTERKPKVTKGERIYHGYSECHRAHKGLFVGLLLFMATLVALALFYIYYNDHRLQSAVTLYQVTDVSLHTIGIFAVLFALLRLRQLSLSDLSDVNAFDDNLLLIGLLGMLFYDMFLLVPAYESRNKEWPAAALFMAKAILEMIQSLMQVFLILEASRRCAQTADHVEQKPGRSFVTFLLVLNLAMWIVNTFELKHAENHKIHSSYYSGIAWKIITHLSLPLLIFFRFHSTVCLADVWSNAYRIRA